MKITQRILFHLLKQNHPSIIEASADRSVVITSATIYDHGYLNESMLYIVPENALSTFRFYHGNAWIFLLSDPSVFRIPDKYLPDCGVILDNISPVQLLEEVFHLILKLHVWDGQLKDALADNVPMEKIFEICRWIAPFPVSVINRDFKVIAYSRDFQSLYGETNRRHLSFDMVNELLSDPKFEDCQKEKQVFLYSQLDQEPIFVCYNIFHGGNYAARLVLYPRTNRISPGELELFAHMAVYIQKSYIQCMGKDELYHQDDTLHHLCRSLIRQSDSVGVSDMERILADYKWSMNDLYQVYCIRFTGRVGFHSISNFLPRELEENWKNSCMIDIENQLIWVVNLTRENLTQDTTQFRKELTYTIRELICKAGVSNCFDNFYYLPNYYRQAVIALESGSEKNPHFWMYYFKDYVLEYIKDQLKVCFTPEQLAHPGIIRLIHYDQLHDAQYIRTIRQYISAKFNASQAAGDLYIHRTTFLKRLERIENIAGINFRDEYELIYILISFLILDLL